MGSPRAHTHLCLQVPLPAAPHRDSEAGRHRVPVDSFTSSSVTLGQLLGLSEPRFSHLGNGTVLCATCLTGTLAEMGT